MFLWSQGRPFPGGAHSADRIHTGGDLFVEELGKAVVGDGPAGTEGRDKGGAGPGKDRCSHAYLLKSGAARCPGGASGIYLSLYGLFRLTPW